MRVEETAVLAASQTSVAVTGALVLSDHVPGPTRGTTTASAELVSRPLSTPLAALSAVALAIEASLEPVPLLEPAPERPLVVVIDRPSPADVADVAVVVVVVEVDDDAGTLTVVVVVDVGAPVVVVVVEDVERTVVVIRGLVLVVAAACEGVLDDVLSVNTRTIKSRGLDHRTQWLLFTERNGLIAILAG